MWTLIFVTTLIVGVAWALQDFVRRDWLGPGSIPIVIGFWVLVGYGIGSFFVFAYMPLGYQLWITAVAAVGCACLRAPSWVVLLLGLAAIPSSYFFALNSPHRGHPRFDEWRAKYPLVDLSGRLVGERLPVNQAPPERETLAAVERLEQALEDERPWRYDALRSLHASKTELFRSMSGFGVDRLLYSALEDLDYERDPEHEFGPRRQPSAEVYSASTSPPTVVSTPPQGESVHWESLLDFLDMERMGWSNADRQAVAFEAHRFAKPQKAESPFELRRIDLVGLLLNPEPVVYESDHLPDMARIDEYTTRSPDEFERHALGRLRSGEEIVTAEAGERIRMLGAIRATKQCLDCHRVERGDLLGAFTYVLARR